MPLIVPPPRSISWGRIRRAIKELLIAAAPGAKVHDRWALRYSLEETLVHLRAESDPSKIHAWMVTISQVTPEEEKINSQHFEELLAVRIYGFMGHEYGNDATNSQQLFEDEVDNVIAYFKVNRLNRLGISEGDGGNYIKDLAVPLPTFELDVKAFGERYDVHTAMCENMMIRVVR